MFDAHLDLTQMADHAHLPTAWSATPLFTTDQRSLLGVEQMRC
jgi:hypothetical protein